MDKLRSISDVAFGLKLFNKKTKKPSNYILRYWEKEFKQIKPKIFSGSRRYYDEYDINLLKNIKYLLKDRGMTLSGVKKVLNSNDSYVDELCNTSINQKNIIKSKLTKIKKLIKEIKNQMAKKTHVKVRLVPEAKPDSPFFYYVKKPAGGEKAKVKLSAKKYNPDTRKHEMFVEKKLPPHSK